MKARAAVILIQNDRIALIERHRQGMHYIVFPGGKVEEDETSSATAARETEEELGLKVNIGRMVAEVWYLGAPQYYFLAKAVGGHFGRGMGSEMNSQADSKKGTYHPIWIKTRDLLKRPLRPKLMAEFVWKAINEGWPDHPLIVTDAPPDEAM